MRLMHSYMQNVHPHQAANESNRTNSSSIEYQIDSIRFDSSILLFTKNAEIPWPSLPNKQATKWNCIWFSLHSSFTFSFAVSYSHQNHTDTHTIWFLYFYFFAFWRIFYCFRHLVLVLLLLTISLFQYVVVVWKCCVRVCCFLRVGTLFLHRFYFASRSLFRFCSIFKRRSLPWCWCYCLLKF